MTHIVDLIHQAHQTGKTKAMPKKAPKAYADLNCAAELVINLRGQEHQLCIRYSNMAEAMKEYDATVKKWLKRSELEGEKAFIILHGNTITACIDLFSVEAVLLIDRQAADLIVRNMARRQQALNAQA